MRASRDKERNDRPALCEALLVAMYRLLLHLLPADFRREHGAECVALFRRTLRDRQRGGGRSAVIRAALRGWRGLLRGTAEEIRDAWKGPARRAGRAPKSLDSLTSVPSGTRIAFFVTVSRELQHALRRLRRAPGFTIPVVLTLALAVGSMTAVFTVARDVLFSPLPFPESARIIWLDHGSRVLEREGGLPMTSGFYVQYRERAAALESIALYREGTSTVTGDGDPERVNVLFATPSLVEVLRVAPHLGRWFSEHEGEPEAQRVAILGHGFWQGRYGGDAGVLGRTITLSDTEYVIVGVMPPGFVHPERSRPDVWVPLRLRVSDIRVAGFNYRGVARLSAGSTRADAAAELSRLIAELPERFPEDVAGLSFIERVRPFPVPKSLKEVIVGATADTLRILLGAAAVVLLMAWANITDLFLMRTEGRRREMAVRRVLGAGRLGVPTLLLSESLLLSLLGGAAGLAFAFAGVQALLVLGPQDMPRIDEVRIDGATVVLTAVLSLVGGMLFGSVPLMRRSYRLAGAPVDSRAGTEAGRARQLLAGAQIALSFVLLISSGLLGQSFQRLLEVDPGFSERSVLVAEIGLPRSRYPTREEAAAFHGRMLERVRALPGVASASVTTCAPLAGTCWGDPVVVEGRARPADENPPTVSRRRVADGYFETMGVSPVAGRLFQLGDHRRNTRVAVIDERMAEIYFPGEDAIGQRVWPDWLGDSAPEWYEVVGVVPHVVTYGLTSPERPSQLYLPLLSHSSAGTPEIHGADLLVRTTTPPLDVVPTVRQVLADLDESLAPGRITTLDEMLRRDRAPMAFTMTLILAAGLSVLILGMVGVYGSVAYSVSKRTREIGVRMAMGAPPRQVARTIVWQGSVVALMGLATGMATARAGSRFLEGMLFGVSGTDIVTHLSVALGLFILSLAACWIPARRASRIDPLAALRSE